MVNDYYLLLSLFYKKKTFFIFPMILQIMFLILYFCILVLSSSFHSLLLQAAFCWLKSSFYSYSLKNYFKESIVLVSQLFSASIEILFYSFPALIL